MKKLGINAAFSERKFDVTFTKGVRLDQQIERQYTAAEHATWTKLYDQLDECRRSQAHPWFARGLEKLGISRERIPSLTDVNAKLRQLTGWEGVAVTGLEDPASFFVGLSERRFPIGNFIREPQDLSYTPAPDVFHDLYGHLPFLAAEPYAAFCQDFGARACRYQDQPEKLRQFETLFWFAVEFPLIKTREGLRIFGGGILSSVGESNYCLSDQPRKLPFQVRDIYQREYHIDQMQQVLFVLDDVDQLFASLDELEALIQGQVA